MKFIFLIIGMSFFSLITKSETSIYKTTENAGMGKQERIENIEKYLVNISNSIMNLESKLEENSKKLKSIEELYQSLKNLKEKNEENRQEEKAKKKSLAQTFDSTEINKIRDDIVSLKNNDIEKIKAQVIELSESIKSIQKLMNRK